MGGSGHLQWPQLAPFHLGYAAYAFYAHPVAIQPVSVTTTDGMNLLVLISNFAIGSFLGAPARRRTWATWLAVVATARVAWLGTGAALMGDGGLQVRVAAAQTTAAASTLEFSQSSAVNPASPALVVMAKLAGEAAAHGARLVVFHEGGLFLDPSSTSASTTGPIARRNGIYLVAPDRMWDPRRPGRVPGNASA